LAPSSTWNPDRTASRRWRRSSHFVRIGGSVNRGLRECVFRGALALRRLQCGGPRRLRSPVTGACTQSERSVKIRPLGNVCAAASDEGVFGETGKWARGRAPLFTLCSKQLFTIVDVKPEQRRAITTGFRWLEARAAKLRPAWLSALPLIERRLRQALICCGAPCRD
jgi:hypothetical protein